MLNNVNTQQAEVEVIGIVRDKDGNPKFDDPHNVPEKVLMALSPEDLTYLISLQEK